MNKYLFLILLVLPLVSAGVEIYGTKNISSVIDIITPSNSSGGGSGSNVTSVSSGDNCILVNPTTGDVVVTFNTSCASVVTGLTSAIANNTYILRTGDSNISSLTFRNNSQINLWANSTGGITKSIAFHMSNRLDRAWLAWYDEDNRLRVAEGYHTQDSSSGENHTAYEIKTSTDPLSASPNDMITRFSLDTDLLLGSLTLSSIDQFTIRNDTSNKFRFNTTSNIFLLGDGTNVAGRIDVSGGRTYVGYTGANAILQSGSDKGLILAANSSSFGSGTDLFIHGSGKVGIGISNNVPSNELYVNGTANATYLSGDGSKITNLTDSSYNASYLKRTGDNATGQYNFTATNDVISIYGTPTGVMDKYLRFYSCPTPTTCTPTFWIGDAVVNTYSGIVQQNLTKPFFFGVGNDALTDVRQFILLSSFGTAIAPTFMLNTLYGIPVEFRFNNTFTSASIAETNISFFKTGAATQKLDWTGTGTIDFSHNLTAKNITAFDTLKAKYLANDSSRTNLAFPFNGSGNATDGRDKLLIEHQEYDLTSVTSMDTAYTNNKDRPVIISITLEAVTDATFDTAYAVLQDGSTANSDCSYGGVDDSVTVAAKEDLDLYFQISCTIQPLEKWQIKSFTGGSGTLTIKTVRETVL